MQSTSNKHGVSKGLVGAPFTVELGIEGPDDEMLCKVNSALRGVVFLRGWTVGRNADKYTVCELSGQSELGRVFDCSFSITFMKCRTEVAMICE